MEEDEETKRRAIDEKQPSVAERRRPPEEIQESSLNMRTREPRRREIPACVSQNQKEKWREQYHGTLNHE